MQFLAISILSVAAESEFKSSMYKMFIIYTRTLATDIQMTLVASKRAVKKKYFVHMKLPSLPYNINNRHSWNDHNNG